LPIFDLRFAERELRASHQRRFAELLIQFVRSVVEGAPAIFVRAAAECRVLSSSSGLNMARRIWRKRRRRATEIANNNGREFLTPPTAQQTGDQALDELVEAPIDLTQRWVNLTAPNGDSIHN
jgi:hypothetical protein